jgi:thimet oligopeptidase
LLKRSDVSTFFHEFGHALHGLLGRTAIASMSGTSVKRDFVELPSQMLEEWLNDKEILQHISEHYVTGTSLPDELIETILTIKNINSGMFIQRQVYLSLLSLAYFDAGQHKDVEAVMKALYKKMRRYTWYDESDHQFASFGHLTGYAAKYYGYMWSRVFALDLFDTIKQHGLLDPEIGQRYVSTVLSKGGSKDPNELLQDFLGRAPNQEAFIRDLGL